MIFRILNCFYNFFDKTIIAYHIIKMIFVSNGTGKIASFMFIRQFWFSFWRFGVFFFPHEAPITFNDFDLFETDVSRRKR